MLPHICVRSISRRCLDETLWNLVEIAYAMWSCPVMDWFFQNGCRNHGNGQNEKKVKNTQMIIAGYSPKTNLWNLIGTTFTSSGTWKSQNNRNRLQRLCCICHRNKKGRIQFLFLFLSSNFIGISSVVYSSFWGWTNSKWRPLPWYPRYQKCNIHSKLQNCLQ